MIGIIVVEDENHANDSIQDNSIESRNKDCSDLMYYHIKMWCLAQPNPWF